MKGSWFETAWDGGFGSTVGTAVGGRGMAGGLEPEGCQICQYVSFGMGYTLFFALLGAFPAMAISSKGRHLKSFL